jgi:hypothetical protein
MWRVRVVVTITAGPAGLFRSSAELVQGRASRKVVKAIVTITIAATRLSHRISPSDHPRALSLSAPTHLLPWIIPATRVLGLSSMTLAVHSPWVYAFQPHAHRARVHELTNISRQSVVQYGTA